MEVTQRIKARLKEVQDWNSVIDEIEAEAGALASGPEQSLALYDLDTEQGARRAGELSKQTVAMLRRELQAPPASKPPGRVSSPRASRV